MSGRRAPKKATPRFVYVATDGVEAKVGISFDPNKRRAALRKEGRRSVQMVRTWERPHDCNIVEWVVKKTLHDGVWREWFDISVEAMIRHVEDAIALVDAEQHYRLGIPPVRIKTPILPPPKPPKPPTYEEICLNMKREFDELWERVKLMTPEERVAAGMPDCLKQFL